MSFLTQNLKPISQAIQSFLKQSSSKQKEKFEEIEVRKAWELISDARTVTYTENVRFYGGTAFIKIISPALKQNLVMQRDEIVAKLNQALGDKAEVKRIFWS